MIIGAMKCGTSSLFDYLKIIPQVCPALTKEPEFFSEHQGHRYHVEVYDKLFNFNANKHKYVLEASTGYTKYPMEPNVARKIFEYGINPKFIYIVRNPFDRIESHYNFMVRKGSIKIKIDSSHLVNLSNYFLQLEQFRIYFPSENLLLLDFDNLKTHPKQVLYDVFEFIGLTKNFMPDKFIVSNETANENRVINEYRSRYNKILPYIPKPIKLLGAKLMRLKFPEQNRRLSDIEREYIYQALKDDMLKFSKVYDFDVSKWGFKSE
ncbi:hypothetical protein D770_08205 [Flammeovirgaceae bacterium 311]|nr:hypothetical protein D770_08205 [Flammeovirgaceae bacterium 311]